MSKASGDTKIGPTAHYTAYVWHRLRLPNAEHFATRRGALLFWAYRIAGEWTSLRSPEAPSLVRWLEFRHRAIDSALGTLAPDRVAEIGAGLSRRGMTWAERGVDYIELDLPAMIAAKTALLPATTSARLRLVNADALSSDFAAQLSELLAGATRPVVVSEGLLGYFERADKIRILTAARQALESTGGGHYLAALGRQAQPEEAGLTTHASRLATRLVLRGRRPGNDFESDDDVKSAFEAAGFREAAPVARPTSPAIAGAVWKASI